MELSTSKPIVIILMGPPGAGKGTHASTLTQELNLPHISTGDLFRQNIKSQTELGILVKKYIDQGALVPDELVIDMLFDRVAKSDCQNGFILDGFPRTVPQAKILQSKIGDSKQVLVINLNLNDEIIIERISGRLSCKGCGKPYHKTFAPPSNQSICDLCSSELIQRDDDREEIIRKRLDVYRSQTEPLIEFYKSKKGILKEIDSKNTKEKVFEDLLNALPKIEALSKT